ncbi:hypothetical protein AVEN_65501-1, partial [Araneus ventricosus]
ASIGLCVKRWMNFRNDERTTYLLLTDSLSVLQALQILSIKSNKIILRLAAKDATRDKFHQNIVLLLDLLSMQVSNGTKSRQFGQTA